MKFGSAGKSDYGQIQAKTINKTIDFPEITFENISQF
jgi:hypothetical protein